MKRKSSIPPADAAAAELASELFGEVGAVSVRRMFGGGGVYLEGIMVGLIADGELYLKSSPETEALFRAAGSRPFEYTRSGRADPVRMSYWSLPEEALDDPDQATLWGRRALAAARTASRR